MQCSTQNLQQNPIQSSVPAAAELDCELRGCHWRPEAVRDRERQRFALDLHDEFGQLITALQLQLSALEHQQQLTMADIQELSALAQNMRRSLAALLSDLQPVARFGDLRAGLQWLCDEHRRRYDRRCHLQWPPSVPVLPEAAQNALFRICQEALTNCARHAQAHNVEVSLQAKPTALRLTITDDGIGAPQPLPAGGLGLTGMRERVEGLGGQFFIDRPATGGFQIRVELPLTSSLNEPGPGPESQP